MWAKAISNSLKCIFVVYFANVRNYECNHEYYVTGSRGLVLLGTGQLTASLRSFTYIS